MTNSEKNKKKLQIIEAIVHLSSIGFSSNQIGKYCWETGQVILNFTALGVKYPFKQARIDNLLEKLTFMIVESRNPEFQTLLRLRDLYDMPNSNMQELMEEASKRAKEKIKKYI